MIELEIDDTISSIKNFLDKNNGEHPEILSDWIEEINSTHTDIRAVLGGVFKNFEVTIEKEFFDKDDFMNSFENETEEDGQNGSFFSFKEFTEWVGESYFIQYKLKHEDLLEPSIGKVKTAKHLIHYKTKELERLYACDSAYDKKRINDLVSSFIRCIKENIVSEGKYYIHITTHPLAFVKLGHYHGVDADISCFAQDGCNTAMKYNIANAKNTFVVLVSDKPIDNYNCNGGFIARSLGCYHKDKNAWSIFNSYASGGKSCSLIRTLFKEVMKEIYDESPEMSVNNQNIGHEDSFFHNKIGQFNFFKEDTNKNTLFKLVVPEVYLTDY